MRGGEESLRTEGPEPPQERSRSELPRTASTGQVRGGNQLNGDSSYFYVRGEGAVRGGTANPWRRLYPVRCRRIEYARRGAGEEGALRVWNLLHQIELPGHEGTVEKQPSNIRLQSRPIVAVDTGSTGPIPEGRAPCGFILHADALPRRSTSRNSPATLRFAFCGGLWWGVRRTSDPAPKPLCVTASIQAKETANSVGISLIRSDARK